MRVLRAYHVQARSKYIFREMYIINQSELL